MGDGSIYHPTRYEAISTELLCRAKAVVRDTGGVTIFANKVMQHYATSFTTTMKAFGYIADRFSSEGYKATLSKDGDLTIEKIEAAKTGKMEAQAE